MSIIDYLRARVNTAARALGAGEEGATATEYVFLLVLIALIVSAGMIVVGNSIDAKFDGAGSSITTTTN